MIIYCIGRRKHFLDDDFILFFVVAPTDLFVKVLFLHKPSILLLLLEVEAPLPFLQLRSQQLKLKGFKLCMSLVRIKHDLEQCLSAARSRQ